MACRQAGEFLQRPDHRIERIGNADDERFRRIFLYAGADLLHHFQIDAEKVIAAHAGLAGHAGGDDANIGPFDRGVVVDASVFHIEPVDRGRLSNVESFALRNAFGDIEQHHIAQFLEADKVSQRAANHAGADEGDLVACHVGCFPFVCDRAVTVPEEHLGQE